MNEIKLLVKRVEEERDDMHQYLDILERRLELLKQDIK